MWKTLKSVVRPQGRYKLVTSVMSKLTDGLLVNAYDNTIRYLLEDGLLIHPDAIAGYNQLAAKKMGQEKNKKDK